jgi:hypothetical protein
VDGPGVSLRSSTYSEDLFLETNHLYSLDIFAHAAASSNGNDGGFATSMSVWIDPLLTVSEAGYQIVLSGGIGNSFATTPIPAALPLFASALGGLGFAGWRRKRAA